MPRIKYTGWNPSDQSAMMVQCAGEIIDEYEAQGYTLTLRQLYYQFVSRDIIPNTERSYKNLGNLITKARMAGMLDWNSIEDRGREFIDPWMEESIPNLLKRLRWNIRYDRWARQDNYVEVWVEKEALGNVVAKACKPTCTPYLACKGYLSASEAWRAGQRMEAAIARDQNPIIIHLGDHDPSGIDMTRDNQDRVNLFSFDNVDVDRIALNMDQVRQYNPPPNPTKLSDTRARDYIMLYDNESWELDALEPKVIEDLITKKIDGLIDWDVWNSIDIEETKKIKQLKDLYDRWEMVEEFLDE